MPAPLTVLDPHDFPDGVIRIRLQGDVNDRLRIHANGDIWSGDGATAPVLVLDVSAALQAAPAVTAASVTILDAANDFTATNVETALAELQSDNEAAAAAQAATNADFESRIAALEIL